MQFLKLFKDFVSVALGSSVARGLALANTLIIARVLGPSDFGNFSIFYSVMILSWQLPQSFDGVFVSLAKKLETKADKLDYLKSSITCKFLYLLILLALSYPLALLIGDLYFGKPNSILPLIYAFLCGSSLTFLMTIASTYQEEERFAHFASMHAVYTASIFVGLLFLLITKIQFTLNLIFFGYVLISILIGLFSIISLFKKIGGLSDVKRSDLLKTFEQGKWLFFANATYCIFARIDVLYLPRYVSYEDLGQYAVSVLLVQVVTLAVSPLVGIFLPRASLAIRSKKSFNHFIKESLFAILLIEIGICLYFMVVPYIVIYLYGDQYVLSVKILRILLLGWVFGVIFIPLSFIFIALEDSKTRFYIELINFIIAFSLLNIFVPWYGITGAAYAISLTLCFSLIISFVILKLRLKTAFRDHSLA